MVMVRVTLEGVADWLLVGVPFVGFPLYKYVARGVKGDCRNIFHERSVILLCLFFRSNIKDLQIASDFLALLWIAGVLV